MNASNHETDDVWATVGPKALDSADKYFDNNLRTIFQELLQNCRRGGASAVDIKISRKDQRITIADNGRGIARADLPTVLQFGGSKNESVTEHDETPAGMGLYAIALRTSMLLSQDWLCPLTPDVMRGRQPAKVVSGHEPIAGTRVIFAHAMEDADRYAEAVITAYDIARSMPFSTNVNDRAVKRTPSTSVLIAQDLDGSPAPDKVRTASAAVGDCTVTVARFDDALCRRSPGDHLLDIRDPEVKPRAKALWKSDRMNPVPQVYIDIFGHVLFEAKTSFADTDRPFAMGLRAIPMIEAPVYRVGASGEIQASIPCYTVLIECLGTTKVVPRLPDRRTLVDTPGLDEVWATVMRLMVTLATSTPANALTVSPADFGAEDGNMPQIVFYSGSDPVANMLRREAPYAPRHVYEMGVPLGGSALPDDAVVCAIDSGDASNIMANVGLAILDAGPRSAFSKLVFTDCPRRVLDEILPRDWVDDIWMHTDGRRTCIMQDGARSIYAAHEVAAVTKKGFELFKAIDLRMTTRTGRQSRMRIPFFAGACDACASISVGYTKAVDLETASDMLTSMTASMSAVMIELAKSIMVQMVLDYEARLLPRYTTLFAIVREAIEHRGEGISRMTVHVDTDADGESTMSFEATTTDGETVTLRYAPDGSTGGEDTA